MIWQAFGTVPRFVAAKVVYLAILGARVIDPSFIFILFPYSTARKRTGPDLEIHHDNQILRVIDIVPF